MYVCMVLIGRILSIPIAIFLSSTWMIRMQLTLCLVGSILVTTIVSRSYTDILIASVTFGYALSSIQAAAMTIITDYDYIL
jgi:hypothetical protein